MKAQEKQSRYFTVFQKKLDYQTHGGNFVKS